jgi:hypothetical protein
VLPSTVFLRVPPTERIETVPLTNPVDLALRRADLAGPVSREQRSQLEVDIINACVGNDDTDFRDDSMSCKQQESSSLAGYKHYAPRLPTESLVEWVKRVA